MQIDLRIASSKPVAEIVDFARRCEEAGFSGLGFVDSHTFLRDVYVVMAQVLQHTERIRVRPAVTCPGPRRHSAPGTARRAYPLCPIGHRTSLRV